MNVIGTRHSLAPAGELLKKLIMNSYLIGFVSLIFLTVQSQEIDKVENFSKEIINIIKNRDVERFCEIEISENGKIDDYILGYIFGDDTYDGFTSFFKNENLIIKTYGPYKNSSDTYYHIMYYLPEILNDENQISAEINLSGIWGIKYLETLVTIEDNKLKFYQTPFYFETDYPW